MIKDYSMGSIMGALFLFLTFIVLARSESGHQLHEKTAWFSLTSLYCYGLHNCKTSIPLVRISKIKGEK